MFSFFTRSSVFTLGTLLMAGTVLAGPHEVETCEQNGTTLSGSCIDGTQFELTCTDEVNPVECDFFEEVAWDICGDQCESSHSTTLRDRRERAFGATSTSSQPWRRARMRRRANQRQARQHHEQIVAGDDGRSLSISIRKSHSGN